MRSSHRVRFENPRGQTLVGILELPATPRAWALFAPCFTCTKDLKAIVRISRRLADQGIAVLRIDFTGLGDSSGEFSATNFITTQEDLRAAAAFLQQHHQPPQLLIGHSLGGAASLAAAASLSTVRGVVTIAAPSDTTHLADRLTRMNPEIERRGSGEVVIGGTTHRISRQLVETLRAFDLPAVLRALSIPLLIFHSPLDETLDWVHAEQIFQTVRGPRSLVTIDGADHLLVNQPGDVQFVADLIAVWSRRYLPAEI